MGKLFVVSVGVGGIDYITAEAKSAIEQCDTIVAYSKYARELKSIFQGKEIYASGMTFEKQRCEEAINLAKNGQNICVISNGDANVFGVSNIIIQLIDKLDLYDEVEVIIVAGVTAFLAVASKVGAPISQDFAIISLSEKQNNLKMINKRVKLALDGDFILGIYSPRTRKWFNAYANFLEMLKNYDERIVIIASNVGREAEQINITTTTNLIKCGIDNNDISMITLLIVCNSNAKLLKNNLILTTN